MLDSALSLIAAKVKAVGLVAGTAMVTTALVGGGAVAMTTVSNDNDVAPETSVTQDALAVTETESDTKTVGIHPKEPKAPKEEKAPKADKPRVPTVDFVCDESLNHGQNVSAFAKSLEKGPGRGEQISAVAQSDCGKKAGEDSVEDELEVESDEAEEAEEVEVEKTAEEKAAKKDAQAEKKADRKGAAAEKKAGKGKK